MTKTEEFPKIKSAQHALREILKICNDKADYLLISTKENTTKIKIALIIHFASEGLKNETSN